MLHMIDACYVVAAGEREANSRTEGQVGTVN